MQQEVVLQRSGDSVSVVIPAAVLVRHGLQNSDRAFLVETEGGILITARDPAFSSAMEAAQRGMDKYRNALGKLAKEDR